LLDKSAINVIGLKIPGQVAINIAGFEITGQVAINIAGKVTSLDIFVLEVTIKIARQKAIKIAGLYFPDSNRTTSKLGHYVTEEVAE
jgi:hypothetical protein